MASACNIHYEKFGALSEKLIVNGSIIWVVAALIPL